LPDTEAQSTSHAIRSWWREAVRREGLLSAGRQFAASLREFALDSTPDRRRARYGDADYDWDHRVNTTAGGLDWRARLIGTLHSPYQPTDPETFQAMIADWMDKTAANPRAFTFCDLGSGKGRTLLMASHYPFRRIVGVELLASLHVIAQENIARYKSESQQCAVIESICADATEFPLPPGPLLLYLFNPFPAAGLKKLLIHLEPRMRSACDVHVLYHNPLLEDLLEAQSGLKKLGGTHQYSIYSNGA